MHSLLQGAKRVVIKIGSSLLTNEGKGLDQAAIAQWADQIAALKRMGMEVVLVSSGAIAEGMQRLGWTRRPHALHDLQAAAAVGQMGLVQVYERSFHAHGIHTAQILLTHEDLADRRRYLNARSTLRTLLDIGVVPIINENDTVVVDEIRFGDNDTLGALVTNLIEADCLVILTDQAGLYTSDPRKDSHARLVDRAEAGAPELEVMAGGAGSAIGTGGMATKVLATKRAARSGAHTVIVSGREPKVLTRLADGEAMGTHLRAAHKPMAARKQWLADHLQVRGKLWLDRGAVEALIQDGKSLLSIGVAAIEGDFERGELVSCLDRQGHEIARGLVNYSAEDSRKIMHHPTSSIEELLGFIDEEELIHRDNLVILTPSLSAQ
jgi:glutamate 5-kinase